MVRIPKTFLDKVLWPEFRELDKALRAHLEQITERVIHQAIHSNTEEADVRDEPEPRLLP